MHDRKKETTEGVKGAVTERGLQRKQKADEKRQEATLQRDFFQELEAERQRKAAAHREATIQRRAKAVQARADMVLRNKMSAQKMEKDLMTKINVAKTKIMLAAREGGRTAPAVDAHLTRRHEAGAVAFRMRTALSPSHDVSPCGTSFPRGLTRRGDLSPPTHLRSEDKRQSRLKIFSSRYVPAEAAAEFDGSLFRKLYSMDTVAELEIGAQNKAQRARIKATAARTDDDLTDDGAAYEARQKMAQQSKERKAAEEAERQRQNDLYRSKARPPQTLPGCPPVLDPFSAHNPSQSPPPQPPGRSLPPSPRQLCSERPTQLSFTPRPGPP